MLIEYRTIEGRLIKHSVNMDQGITFYDIDHLAVQYYEQTFRSPNTVFIDTKEYARIIKTFESQLRYSSGGANSGATAGIQAFHLSTGQIQAVAISNLYIPVLVGSRDELIQNDINKNFEDIILRCGENS